MTKNVVHVDEKILQPNDSASNKVKRHDVSKVDDETKAKHYDKPIRGFAVISDMKGNVLDTPNLVVLPGREFLAQKLSDVRGNSNFPESDVDLSKFKITYFGVGEGGADSGEQPSKIGPYDNDTDNADPGKFADDSKDEDSTLKADERYKYIHDGKMKKILSGDGADISIIEETHNITVNGEEIEVKAWTTIKYTLIVSGDELYKEDDEEGPFAFNEAALYTVEHEMIEEDGELYSVPATDDSGEEDSRYVADWRLFARFTTLTKWLEDNDSVKIEWYILV